jgi:dolichol-phosphate mannosyltransferase
MTSIAMPAELAVEAPVAERPAPSRVADYPITFVIPAYNEEDNLPRLFADLECRPWFFRNAGSRVIVVDDGSSDRTAELVESYSGKLPVELVRLEHNQGPGAAFRSGFEQALEGTTGEAFIVTLEADTTSDLEALTAMLAEASAGAELVLASWTMVNVSRRRKLLSAGAAFVFRRALGIDAQTVSSFFRVYRASVLRRSFAHYGSDLMRERGFACKAELLANIARLGAQIAEVPVELDTDRRIGKSKMPIVKTVVAYLRMLARQRRDRGETLEAGEALLGEVA